MQWLAWGHPAFTWPLIPYLYGGSFCWAHSVFEAFDVVLFIFFMNDICRILSQGRAKLWAVLAQGCWSSFPFDGWTFWSLKSSLILGASMHRSSWKERGIEVFQWARIWANVSICMCFFPCQRMSIRGCKIAGELQQNRDERPKSGQEAYGAG